MSEGKGTYGAVIARVRNQGGFGICWAMAIISVMEIVIAKQYNEHTILSSQEMVDSLWAKLKSRKSTPEKVDQFGGYAMDIGTVFNWMESFGVVNAASCPYMGERRHFRERPPVSFFSILLCIFKTMQYYFREYFKLNFLF